MAQKAFPNSLRKNIEIYEGSSFWDNSNFNFIKHNVKTLMKRCCLNTSIALNKIVIKQYHNSLFIQVDLIQLHSHGLKRYISRRHKENKRKNELESWQKVAQRLNLCTQFLCSVLPYKNVHLKVARLKTFSKHIPLEVRQKMSFYKRIYNIPRYPYARFGLQIMNLVAKGKASALTMANFLESNMKTRQRRKRHHQFLRFIQQGFQALEPKKQVSLKLQIKGRFGRRAKGRSQTWKLTMGFVPFGRLQLPIDTVYRETRTAYGGVGLKVFLCKHNFNTHEKAEFTKKLI